MIQSDKYIAMSESGKYLHSILYETAEIVKPGVNVLQVEAHVNLLFDKYNVVPSFLGYDGFPSSICLSVNDEVVHGIPKDYILTDQDIITLDCGVCVDGYHTDSAITLFVGDRAMYSKEIQNLVDTTELALKRALQLIRPGIRLGLISNIIGQTAIENGLNVVHDLGGHGIGKEVHMEPFVANYGRKEDGPILKEGMTLAIEPIFCLGKPDIIVDKKDHWTITTKDGKWSAQFEHTIFITASGCEILT